MKILPDKEVMNKREPKKEVLFVFLAFTFAAIATFTKFDLAESVRIVLYSLPLSAVFYFAYIKFDSILKIDQRIKKLSFGTVLVALLVIPRLIFNNAEPFIKYVLFWMAVELLSLSFLLDKRKNETNKPIMANRE